MIMTAVGQGLPYDIGEIYSIYVTDIGLKYSPFDMGAIAPKYLTVNTVCHCKSAGSLTANLYLLNWPAEEAREDPETGASLRDGRQTLDESYATAHD